MKIAVMMSTYNGEKFLRQQIESILYQNLQNNEFLLDLWVRDDGSTDNTRNILKSYEKYDNFQWYCGKNIGVAYSFLDLIYHCKNYDIYAFADQDDYWNKDKIQSAINILTEKEKPCLYFSNARLVGENLEDFKRDVYKRCPSLDFESLVCAGGILGCTMVFNYSLARYIQEKSKPKKIIMHDYYVATLCKSLNGTIIYDNISHMKYRQHSNNVVGVVHGLIPTIKNRIKNILIKKEVTIGDQANSILMLYYNEIDKDKIKWLKKVSNYKYNFQNRLLLAFSNKTKYMNYNSSITIRMSILFGNR